jgi:hypothetical protein
MLLVWDVTNKQNYMLWGLSSAADSHPAQEISLRWLPSRMLCHVVWQKFTDVSEVLASSIIRARIALMMEATSTSEMLVNFYQTTQHNDSEHSHLHTRCNENLKSHKKFLGIESQKFISVFIH